MREINLIVVHCSATEAGKNYRAVDINRWHIERGWSGIGYHAVIPIDGTLERGRPLHQAGAHAYGYNKNSIGICLIGGMKNGKPADTFLEVQLCTLGGYLDTLFDLFPQAVLRGHRDLSPDVNGDGIIEPWEWMKECPCIDVQTWYKRRNTWNS